VHRSVKPEFFKLLETDEEGRKLISRVAVLSDIAHPDECADQSIDEELGKGEHSSVWPEDSVVIGILDFGFAFAHERFRLKGRRLRARCPTGTRSRPVPSTDGWRSATAARMRRFSMPSGGLAGPALAALRLATDGARDPRAGPCWRLSPRREQAMAAADRLCPTAGGDRRRHLRGEPGLVRPRRNPLHRVGITRPPSRRLMDLRLPLPCCMLVLFQAPPALVWRGVGHRSTCVIMFREMDG
jgi:hypothetical protein